MTNEEWIEELYHSANDIGLFNKMHPKINELKKQHRDLILYLIISKLISLFFTQINKNSKYLSQVL